MEAILKIMKNEAPRLEQGSYGEELREFVADCLMKDPSDRLTAEELLVKYSSLWKLAKSDRWLLETLGPFDDFNIPDETEGDVVDQKVNKGSNKVIWDFDLGGDEEEFDQKYKHMDV